MSYDPHRRGGNTKVLVGHLPPDCRERDLEQLFGGRAVRRVEFLGPRKAVVDFETTHQAQDAIHQWNDRMFRGQQIYVKMYRERSDADRDRRYDDRDIGADRDGRHYDDHRGERGSPPDRRTRQGGDYYNDDYDRRRDYDDRRREEDHHRRSRSPPPRRDEYRRSRSPPSRREDEFRRSPPSRRDDEYHRPPSRRDEDYRRGPRRRSPSPPPPSRPRDDPYGPGMMSSVVESKKTTKKQQGAGDEHSRVFIGCLADQVTRVDLQRHFSTIGKVVFAQVKTDRSTQKSKGCGVVDYISSDLAQQAVDQLDDTELCGRRIQVSILICLLY